MTSPASEKPGIRPRRRVYLLRHGEVSYFDSDGRPFRPDTVPLNTEGRKQAEAAAQSLAVVPLDRVISSGLPRSHETAAILSAGRGLAIETREELREIRPGRIGDISADSIEQAFIGAFAGINRETRFLGGESFGSLVDRVLACFNGELTKNDWHHLLIVAHGGVNRVILAHTLGMGLAGFANIEQDAACINIFDVDSDGRFLVRLVNFTPYSPAKVGLEHSTMERLYLDYRSRKEKR